MFCSYRNWNKQLSRKKTLFRAWIRQEYCVKPLANEFNGLIHLNSCLFKILRNNVYINQTEMDVFIIFVSRETSFSWSAWILLLFHVKQKGVEYWRTKRPRFHVKQLRVILYFFNKTERNKRFLIRNEVYLKLLRIILQKRKKTLKIKKKLRQAPIFCLKWAL